MAGGFRGTFRHKVDAKSRVSVPAAFRRAIESGDPAWNQECGGQPRVILVQSMHENHCLDCYTKSDMTALENLALDSDDYDVREDFFEDVAANSHELRLDENGRILIPPDMRKDLDIGPEAIFVGKLDRFEIWAPDARDAHREARMQAGGGGRREMLRKLMRRPRAGDEA